MALAIKPPKRDAPPAGRQRGGLDLLLRLGAWGGTAVLAMVALAVTLQTDVGSERLRQAYIELSSSAGVTAAIPRASEAETRALEAQLRLLTADRDRLAARMASLERHLDDVTGSIARVAAEKSAAQAPPAEAVPPPPQPSTPAVVAAVEPSAPPAPPPPKFDPLAHPAIGEAPGGWPALEDPPTEPAEAAGPQMAVPLPPPRFVTAVPEPPPLPMTEFGIELATAGNVEQLRARWATLKANHGPLLAGLQPVAVRERRPGGVTEYKLIAGPLPHLAAARQLCTRFADAHAACRAAKINANNVVQQ